MVKVSGGQILISGGSGFIGRYVVELLQDEYDVVVIDQIKPNYKTKFTIPICRLMFSFDNSNLVSLLLFSGQFS